MRPVPLLTLPLLAACAASPDAPPNILLVSLDTVRFDRTSLGGPRDTTPNLARLAARGSSWTQAWAVGNESITSHASLFTGLYPSEVALPDYGSFSIPAEVPTLASVLAAYGYRTGGFSGGGHVIPEFGLAQGFQVFTSATGDTRAGSLYDSVPAALAWIEEQGPAPWFAFVHGYDAHSPYVQPGPFRHLWGNAVEAGQMEDIAASPLAVEQLRGHRWFPDRRPQDFLHAGGTRLLGLEIYTHPAEPRPGERVVELSDAEVQHLRDHYDTGLTYGDVWLGLLLEGIDLDETLVIVVSDHGEDLLDHGYVNHRAGLWDSTLHVPLVVAGPGFSGGSIRTGPVDLRSVLPTALRAAGATLPAGVVAPALQEDPSAPWVYAEGVMDMVSVQNGEHALVLSDARLAAGAPDLGTRSIGSGTAALYEGRNPENRLVVGDAEALATAEELRAELLRLRSALHPASATGSPVPEELRAALRERGYWTPGAPVEE